MPNPAQKAKQEREVVSAQSLVEKHGGQSVKYLQIPNGVNQFTVKKEQTYRLNFLPFRAKEGNPFAPAPGKLYFERTIWIHGMIGPGKEKHLCAAKSLSMPCPICEHRAQLSLELAKMKEKDKDFEEMVRRLKWSERQLFLVEDVDNPERGAQLWDYSEWLFGKYLRAKLERSPREKNYRLFADPVDGFTLNLGAKEENLGGGKCYTLSDIEFEKRSRQIPTATIQAALKLYPDDWVVATDYNELADLYYQRSRDETETESEAIQETGAEEDQTTQAQEETQPATEETAAEEPAAEEESPAEEDEVQVEEVSENAETEQAAEEPAAEEEAPATEEVAAEEEPVSVAALGFEPGEFVLCEGLEGKCEIVKIHGDVAVTIEDAEGNFYKQVDPRLLKKITAPPKPAAVKPATPKPPAKPAPTKSEDVPFEEPAAAKAAAPKPVAPPPKKPVAPAPAPAVRKPVAPPAKPTAAAPKPPAPPPKPVAKK